MSDVAKSATALMVPRSDLEMTSDTRDTGRGHIDQLRDVRSSYSWRRGVVDGPIAVDQGDGGQL